MSNQQKILHIVEAFGGGVVTYLNSLVHGQCELGYEVYVAYGKRAETPLDFAKDFDPRVHWIEIKNFKRSIGINDLKVIMELLKINRSVKPDFIHSHSSKAGAICRILFRYKHVPQFYTPHGFAFLMSNISNNKRKFYYLVEKFCAKYTKSMTVACSKNEYQNSIKLCKRAAEIDNGVSPTYLKTFCKDKPFNQEKPVVCFAGRIITQKNPKLFNEIALAMPELQFIWIGDGLLRGVLNAPNIEITGWLSREETLHKVAESDIFILPSLWEGLSMSLLEAMYMKKLCLVTDNPGCMDVIQHGKNGFVGHDAKDFVAIINDVISGKYDVEQILSTVRADIMEKYNADVMAKRYDNIYRSQK